MEMCRHIIAQLEEPVNFRKCSDGIRGDMVHTVSRTGNPHHSLFLDKFSVVASLVSDPGYNVGDQIPESLNLSAHGPDVRALAQRLGIEPLAQLVTDTLVATAKGQLTKNVKFESNYGADFCRFCGEASEFFPDAQVFAPSAPPQDWQFVQAAHKVILAARSEFLEQSIASGMVESGLSRPPPPLSPPQLNLLFSNDCSRSD